MSARGTCYGRATMRTSCDCPAVKCDTCGEMVDHVNEASWCEQCHDDWMDAEIKHWKPLWLGEKQAGLIRDKNDE